MPISLSQKASQKEYKYRINEIMNTVLPRTFTIDLICEYLDCNGINKRTFNRDRAIKIDETACIPENRIRIYAKAFDVEINQMFNEPIDQSPILHLHEKSQKAGKRIANEFNLD